MGGELLVWVMVGIFVALLLFIIGLGIFYPGTGAEQLDWKPTRSPETEAENEVDDLSQMLAATNAKRRARGARELSEATLHSQINEDTALRRSLSQRAAATSEGGEDPELEEERRQLAEARERRRLRREGGA